MIPGFTTRLTKGGIPVARIHYSVDPAKRPGTADGDAWIHRAGSAYPGGTSSPRWRKEMEIEWGALGGMRVFPEWEQWIAAGAIVIPPFEPVGYKLYGSYDHGWRNPAAYHVHAVNGDGAIATVWEFYGSGVGTLHIAKIIKGEDVVLPDGRRFTGNPYAGKEAVKVADPSIWAEDQPMADGQNKSIAELFRRNGVYFQQGERGGDGMVAEWLHGHFWRDPTAPLYRICCSPEFAAGGKPSGAYAGHGAPWLIWELGQQRHRDISSRVALNRDQPEALVDKDNHAWDGLKMFLKRFPPKPVEKTPAGSPNTFNWWRELARKGGGISRQPVTYRVGG